MAKKLSLYGSIFLLTDKPPLLGGGLSVKYKGASQ